VKGVPKEGRTERLKKHQANSSHLWQGGKPANWLRKGREKGEGGSFPMAIGKGTRKTNDKATKKLTNINWMRNQSKDKGARGRIKKRKTQNLPEKRR